MLVKKKISAGEPGSQKYIRKYGDKLVCIRYRYDKEAEERITTVELIEEKGKIKTGRKPPHNKKVLVKIDYDEYALRQNIKMYGGTWNKERKLWEIDYKTAAELNITSRIKLARLWRGRSRKMKQGRLLFNNRQLHLANTVQNQECFSSNG